MALAKGTELGKQFDAEGAWIRIFLSKIGRVIAGLQAQIILVSRDWRLFRNGKLLCATASRSRRSPGFLPQGRTWCRAWPRRRQRLPKTFPDLPAWHSLLPAPCPRFWLLPLTTGKNFFLWSSLCCRPGMQAGRRCWKDLRLKRGTIMRVRHSDQPDILLNLVSMPTRYLYLPYGRLTSSFNDSVVFLKWDHHRYPWFQRYSWGRPRPASIQYTPFHTFFPGQVRRMTEQLKWIAAIKKVMHCLP